MVCEEVPGNFQHNVLMAWGTILFELDSTNRYDLLGSFLLSMVAFLYVVNESLLNYRT